MNRKSLSRAIKLVFVGYIFLHLNVNLGSINVLPNWIGYILLLKALPALGTAVPSANLLRPLGILLAIWEGGIWLFTAVTGEEPVFYLVTVIGSIIDLYFHFQLLTNLAEIALKIGSAKEKMLLYLRTARTILITAFALPVPWEQWNQMAIGLVAANLIIVIWLCSTLISLRRELNKEPSAEA